MKKHFGDLIVISEVTGKVTPHSTAAEVLNDFHEEREDTIDGKKNPPKKTKNTQIIEGAANLIKNDIKNTKMPKGVHPSCSAMPSGDDSTNFLPETLRTFLKMTFAGKDI